MSLLVVDCSVTMSWFFSADQLTAEQARISRHTLELVREGTLLVPELWGLEVANVIARGRRKGVQVDAGKDAEFLALLAALPKEVESHGPERAFGDILELARKHGLTSYDATYLELARRRAVPLASLDDALREACLKDGVALVG